MNIIKRIFGYIILFPNLPFILGLVTYVLFKIIKHNGIHELLMMNEGEISESEEINVFIKNSYPFWLQVSVAIFLYICMFFAFII